MSPPREREASLAVASREPGRTADRVAELEELAGLRLEALPERRLRDVYLDRPSAELRAAGLALRLRREDDGLPTLALKGDERTLRGGGTDRLELEGPWGEAALSAVREALEAAGLPAGWLPADPGPGDPLDRLVARGWRPVQDRVTRRRPRRMEDPDGENVGELAMDEVRFRAAGRTAVHREAEVEAAPGGEPPGRAAAALLDRFPDDLRPWDHPKLATGRALERLLAGDDGDPDRWLGPGGDLRPEAYGRLEAILAEG